MCLFCFQAFFVSFFFFGALVGIRMTLALMVEESVDGMVCGCEQCGFGDWNVGGGTYFVTSIAGLCAIAGCVVVHVALLVFCVVLMLLFCFAFSVFSSLSAFFLRIAFFVFCVCFSVRHFASVNNGGIDSKGRLGEG